MSELEELREIRAILAAMRDMERASLELQRRQEQRVEHSPRIQEVAVARQRTALRLGLAVTVVVAVVLAPLLYWLRTRL